MFYYVSVSSDSFDFPNLPFKATLLISDQMNVSGIHKYVVNDNKVSAQMVFTYSDSSNPASFSTADYEEIEVVYNFNSDSLVSFVWTSYDVETDSLFRYQYANGSLKMLVDDQSPEYFELKTSIKNKAQTLYNATLTNKTYDFTQQYKEIYNEYNPDSPLV